MRSLAGQLGHSVPARARPRPGRGGAAPDSAMRLAAPATLTIPTALLRGVWSIDSLTSSRRSGRGVPYDRLGRI